MDSHTDSHYMFVPAQITTNIVAYVLVWGDLFDETSMSGHKPLVSEWFGIKQVSVQLFLPKEVERFIY